MTEYTAYLLDEAQIRHYWPKLEECLDAEPELWAKALSKEDIFKRSLHGAIQMWAVCNQDTIHIAFMTQVIESKVERILQVWWMFGRDLEASLPCLDMVLNDYMNTIEADKLEVVGRKGFEKMLKPWGFRYEYSLYSRPVRPKDRRN